MILDWVRGPARRRPRDFTARSGIGHTASTLPRNGVPVHTAHFTDTYLPRRDGVITSVRTLVAGLDALGHRTLTVVPRHPAQPDDPALLRLPALRCGVADLRMSPWPLRPRTAAAALADIAAAGVDVVHVHTPGPVGLLGVLAARSLGLPLVHTYHTDLHAYADAYRIPGAALRGCLRLYAHRLGLPRPHVPVARGGGVAGTRSGRRAVAAGRRRATLDAGNALLLADADAVVLPTRAVLDRVTLPVPDDRVFVLPTGVAPRPTTEAAVRAIRAAHGLRRADRVVLFVGRVNREKGVELLVQAFAAAAATRPDARLLLVGAIYEPRWLDALLQAAGVAGRVVCTGQLPPDAVAAAYGAADVFAFPSTTDTQALVLQEAALAGVPVVMADAALHRHGPLAGAAVLTGPRPPELAAGIGAVLDNSAAAARLAADAARNAARHTPAAYAASMYDVYSWVRARTDRVYVRGRSRR